MSKKHEFNGLPELNSGLFQLCGPPGTNYEYFVYQRAIKECKTGTRILWIDNNRFIDKNDLSNKLTPEELNEFFVFSPDKMSDYISIVDNLDIYYLNEPSIICISNIFEFLVKNPVHKHNLVLTTWILGQLKMLSVKLGLTILVSNELRKTKSYPRPFLAYLLPRFFNRVFIMEYKQGKAFFREYLYTLKKKIKLS